MDKRLNSDEAQNIIRVINKYSKAFTLIDEYDYKKISKPYGTICENKIKYEDCIKLINKMKFNCDSKLFALQRNDGLKAIISAIYQSYDGKDVYPTIEEKTANLIYLITKDHVFVDGNKRIAATLFIYFLDFYKLLYNDGNKIIDNNTLVAITLLIAQSNPKEKDILISLVMNFLIKN